ncbi:MAG: hypothetical protein LBU76_10735 [Azoarcus sp.]|nr:hypothetical protein [Azoarcus sp.]
MKQIIPIIFISTCVLFFGCSKDARNKRAQESGRAVTEQQANFIGGVGDGLKGTGKDAAESI